MATVLTVPEANTDGPMFGEVREGLPGSTLERGTHVEKRSRTWETLRVPQLKRDCETSRRTAYGYLATDGETQTRKQTGA